MTVETVDPATLKEWLDAGMAVLVDVREPREYASEHIEGAALVPLGQIRIEAVPDYSGKKLVIMCRMGVRGQAACQKLREELPADEKVYNLQGGIQAWKGAGLPVERRERPASLGLGGLLRSWIAK